MPEVASAQTPSKVEEKKPEYDADGNLIHSEDEDDEDEDQANVS